MRNNLEIVPNFKNTEENFSINIDMSYKSINNDIEGDVVPQWSTAPNSKALPKVRILIPTICWHLFCNLAGIGLQINYLS